MIDNLQQKTKAELLEVILFAQMQIEQNSEEKNILEKQLSKKWFSKECPLIYNVFRKDPEMVMSFYNIKKQKCEENTRYRLLPVVREDGKVSKYIPHVEQMRRPALFGEKEWSNICDSNELNHFENANDYLFQAEIDQSRLERQVAPYLSSTESEESE